MEVVVDLSGYRIAYLGMDLKIEVGRPVRLGLGGPVIGKITKVEDREGALVATLEINEPHRSLIEHINPADFFSPEDFSIGTPDLDLEFHARSAIESARSASPR